MDYAGRLKRFRQQMAAASVDMAFVPISADLQYLTGIPRDMPNYGAVLYPGRWLEGAFIGQNAGPIVTLPRMTAEFHMEGVALGDVRVIADRDDPFAVARGVLAAFKLGDKPRIALGNHAWAETAVNLQKLLPGAIFSSATDLTRPLRRIKSPDEIEVMRRAGTVTEQAFAEVLKKLRHGMTETEITAEVDLQLRSHGAIGPSFVTAMYNSGPNLPLELGHANTHRNKPLLPPVALLFDFGAAFEGYCYDYGRTVSFGEPSAEMTRTYNTIMSSQAAGIKALCAGAATCQDVDRAARAIVTDAGFGPHFRHRLGHGIGMDVHEPPFLTEGDTTLLEEGMAFTIEPSIMMPGGFSARVEDIIVARPGGGEPLTTGFQTLQVID
jgi:Xaa-Pro dipeptidase